MADYLLGLDYGTGGAKACIINPEGEVLGFAFEEYPFFRAATIPGGTYPGQDEPYEGLDVGSMHLIVAADQDEELVYRLTRTLYANREALAEKHPAGRAVNPTNAVRDTGTPFHPGAIRYYTEIGIWPDAAEGEAG